MSNKSGKRKGWIPALIAGGGCFTLFSMIFGVFRGGFHIESFTIGLVLSVGIGALIKTMASGLDLTTHNREDAQKNAIRDAVGKTGNPAVDAILGKGLEMLQQIHDENAKISDEALSQKMDLLERRCTGIFQAVAEKPAKASQIRKLMDYYLPTTLKMLKSYRELGEKGLSVDELIKTRDRINDALEVVVEGCQKSLDKLYRNDILDVTADIDVLEKMLKRDGLTESDFEAIIKQSQKAARIDQETVRIARERNTTRAEGAKAEMGQLNRQGMQQNVEEEQAASGSWKSGVVDKVQGLATKADAHISQVPTMDGGTFYAGAQAQAQHKE